MARPGNKPIRRITSKPVLETEKSYLLQSVKYVGSGHHKLHPADYGFERVNPRPDKSLCDLGRSITIAEAKAYIKKGIELELFSDIRSCGFPKFIWGISEQGEVFESKTDGNGTGDYHGYPIEQEDSFSEYILEKWEEKKCQKVGQ